MSPPKPRCCANCVGWVPHDDDPDLGECDPGGPWPDCEVTPASWSCDKYEERKKEIKR